MHSSRNIDRIGELNENALLMPEYEKALIGFSERDTGEIVAVYAMHMILGCIMEAFSCDYWDALEYYDYNVLGGKLCDPNAAIIVEFFDNLDWVKFGTMPTDANPDSQFVSDASDALDGRAY